MSSPAMPSTDEQPDGYQLVADLLQRQQRVLDGLDELNVRIEAVIEQVTASRQCSLESAAA